MSTAAPSQGAPSRPSWLHRLGPAWLVVSGFAALAVIPVGGTYPTGERGGAESGASGSVALVPADLDASALVPVALLCTSTLAHAWMAWSVRDAGARATCLRAGTWSLAYGVTLALAAMPLFLVFGSLDLAELALRQDTVWPLAQVARQASLPWHETGWLAALSVPAWGVVANPLSVVLVFIAALGAARLPPFDAVAAEAEARTSLYADGSTQRTGNAVLADGVNTLLVAGFVVTLGFGGWSIPWLETARLVVTLDGLVGPGLGTFLTAAVHVGAFATKVVLVVTGLRFMATGWAPLAEDRIAFLCMRLLVPLAIANVFATALWLATRSGLS